MKETNLLGWVNGLPFETEFSIKDAKKAANLTRTSCSKAFFLLCNIGLLDCRINHNTKAYQKTSKWDLKSAIEANSQRIKAKYQKAKPRRQAQRQALKIKQLK